MVIAYEGVLNNGNDEENTVIIAGSSNDAFCNNCTGIGKNV